MSLHPKVDISLSYILYSLLLLYDTIEKGFLYYRENFQHKQKKK